MANQGSFYDRFDAIVLLSVPLDVVLARVADRTNPFGATPADRAKIASDMATYEGRLRAGADYEIVTTTPLADIADALEVVTDGRLLSGSPLSVQDESMPGQRSVSGKLPLLCRPRQKASPGEPSLGTRSGRHIVGAGGKLDSAAGHASKHRE